MPEIKEENLHAKLSEQGDVARGVWEGLENEERRRELSHWRGFGKYTDDRRWTDIGRKTVATLDSISRMTGRPWLKEKKPLRILEWGPGGGANAYALGRLSADYYGVDISQPNLNEAERMLAAENIESFRPVYLVDQITDVRKYIQNPINVFISTAVFQHFPSKEYAYAVLSEIRAVCARDAVGFIQIRYEDGRFKGVEDVKDYKKKFVTATSFGISEFTRACRSVNLDPIFMCDVNEAVNYMTFCLRATAKSP